LQANVGTAEVTMKDCNGRIIVLAYGMNIKMSWSIDVNNYVFRKTVLHKGMVLCRQGVV
jgi:hypothetical protein